MEKITFLTNNAFNKINKIFIDTKFFIYSFILFFALLNADTIFANDLLNNPITEGLKNLLKDASKLIMLLATLAAPVFIGLYQFKKKISDDEMEGKQYDKKTKAVIICYVLIMGASVIVSVASNYFKIGTSA